MVPMSAKVVLVGRVATVKEVIPKKGENFYSLLVAVDRVKPVLRPDGKRMDADFYAVSTSTDCKSLRAGNYVEVTGRLVVKYWTEPKDAPLPTENYRSTHQVQADTVNLVIDDSQKDAREPAPILGRIVSSSLA